MNTSLPKLSRRNAVAGAGTAGALAAVAAVLPLKPQEAARVAKAPVADVDKGGYQETAHVLHYYQTARV